MSNSAIQQIERNIKEARKAIEFGDTLDRLRGNRDFKKVVIEGYFEREAIRLVHLKADPAMQSPQSQASILNQIDAIGALAQYFHTVGQIAELSRKGLAADEQMREELVAEELA